MYARDLDLNLLRVFVVVAETGSVTAAASRLYLTQPAVSAALKRLTTAVGAPLFAKQGRGLVLTARGEALLSSARPHLTALIDAALAPPAFDPRVSDRTVRLGLADSNEQWMLPPLLHALAAEAPRMRVIVLPVQFRTVGHALATGAVDVAVTVADELPAGNARETLFVGGFVALFDPRHIELGARLTRARYLAQRHIIVSYNGDLRGVVEDTFGVNRDIAISVPTFHSIGALVEGAPLMATVPEMVARAIVKERPKLRIAELPFKRMGAPMELVWRRALEHDDAVQFVMNHLRTIAARFSASRSRG